MPPLRGWAREGPRCGSGQFRAQILDPSRAVLLQVSIPQYRSGQFRVAEGYRRLFELEGATSQSLNTDQGNSEGTPSKPLKTRGLSGLFFQPPREASDFRTGRTRNAARETRNPFKDKDFERISNRCAKMAIWRWHDSCRAWILIFKEADRPRRRCILRNDPEGNGSDAPSGCSPRAPSGARNCRDVPVRFSTTPAGHDRRDVSLPRPSALPTLEDRIEIALRQRGNPGRSCPPRRRPDVDGLRALY
jgi:hypothetical protein